MLAIAVARSYDRAGMARLLSALLIAIAMFCAPAALGVGDIAMARPVMTNCAGMSHSAPAEQKSALVESCAIACAAVLGVPAMIEGDRLLSQPLLFMTQPIALSGISPQAEAPPPRNAPAL